MFSGDENNLNMYFLPANKTKNLIDEIGFVSSSGYKAKLENIKYLELKDIFFE